MTDRARATAVIGSRRLYEALIAPGYYIVLSLSLVLGYLLINGFVGAIDSSGLNTTLNPLYDFLGRVLEGGFGEPFVERLFAEGPFVLALYATLVPVFLYLAISTIHRFTLERGVGAVELVVYGPADGTSYFLAGFLKDLVLSLVSVAVVLLFFALSAAATNLAIGPRLLRSLIVVLPLMMAGFAYATLASVVTDNTAASIGIFLGLALLFGLIALGSFMIVEGYARNLVALLSWIIQWTSPLYYWALALQSASAGNILLFALGIALLLLLTAVLLWVSHRVLRVRGVRP